MINSIVSPLNPLSPKWTNWTSGLIIVWGLTTSHFLLKEVEVSPLHISIYGLSGQWTNSKKGGLW